MSTPALYPLLLQPSLHVKVWGGRRLATYLHKSLPTDEPYGESWELHDTAIVENGALAGQTLGDVLKCYGVKLVGEGNNPDEGFPLLAKLLDASDWLSVQVHPNDEQARRLEGDPRGKTEAWVILVAEPDAKLVIGVKTGTTREQLAQAIRDGYLEDLLVFADVKAGDVVYLAANTIHAIGPGLLIYEIQQSSDVTYRLYDWNRLGLDGEPRELHIEKGTQVSNVETLPPITHIDTAQDQVIIVDGEYFRTARHRLNGAPQHVQTQGCFHALTCIEGEVSLTADDTAINLSIGRTALVPAVLTSYTLNGTGVVLRSWQTG